MRAAPYGGQPLVQWSPPSPAAIANALYHAIGNRIRKLPITPEVLPPT
jgi:hypothetical protein